MLIILKICDQLFVIHGMELMLVPNCFWFFFKKKKKIPRKESGIFPSGELFESIVSTTVIDS